MATNPRPITPAVSFFHSLFLKARYAEEFAKWPKPDPETGIVEIPEVVWQEFELLVDSSKLVKRIK